MRLPGCPRDKRDHQRRADENPGCDDAEDGSERGSERAAENDDGDVSGAGHEGPHHPPRPSKRRRDARGAGERVEGRYDAQVVGAGVEDCGVRAEESDQASGKRAAAPIARQTAAEGGPAQAMVLRAPACRMSQEEPALEDEVSAARARALARRKTMRLAAFGREDNG